MRSSRGFTILELLVVMAVVTVMAGMAVPFIQESAVRNTVWTATELIGGQEYVISMRVVEGSPITLSGSDIAVETSWDDFLPLRSEGFDPYGGIYRLNNLQLYEPDDEAKRDLLQQTLDQADYIVISSDRAYDAMPRLPLQ